MTVQLTFADESPEYAAFVAKFRSKKTTDDCYTPPGVYEAVLSWVRWRYGIAEDVPVVRPFWPGGDYERHEYPPGCVVVDNPPFSIAAKILRFYAARRIPFFLFANGLTLFNGLCGVYRVGAVIVRHPVVFENGASVAVGFLTSLGENVLEVAPDLDEAIQAALGAGNAAAELPKYVFPDAVISSAHAKRLCRSGVKFAVPHCEAVFVRSLDAMGKAGIFGGALLLSERAAAERAAAERAAAERAAAERAAAHVWELSPGERELQRMIGLSAERPRQSAADAVSDVLHGAITAKN